MNEEMNDGIIKELSKQAWIFANNQIDNPKPQIVRFQEKFAELIIRGCADYLGPMQYDDGSAIKDMLKHFGIEE